MGCRERANAYYDNRIYVNAVEGSAVRKTAPVQVPPVRLTGQKRSRSTAARSKALQRQRSHLTALGVSGAALLIGLAVMLLSSLETNSALSGEIAAKESELEKLTVYNDAREYEINSSVDLSYVISVATQELGMVRSNASQIVTYSVKDSEYLQQVAQVPAD